MTLRVPARFVVTAGLVLLLALSGWILTGTNAPPDLTTHRKSTALKADPKAHWTTIDLGTAPPGFRETAHAASDTLLAPGLRDTLEALLLAAGETPDPAALKQRLQDLVAQFFGADLVTRALAMAERYVDYRVALGELRPPDGAYGVEALRGSMLARDTLRRQFFDEAEYAALFADQESLDRFTLARLEIEQNPERSPTDKAQAFADAEAEWNPEQRAARAYSQVQVEVAAQTARFDAQATDERTRWTARSAQFGEDAATRFAMLDAQERDWNQRLDLYEHALKTQPSDTALAQWRAETFTDEEALRLEAALALRHANLADTPSANEPP